MLTLKLVLWYFFDSERGLNLKYGYMGGGFVTIKLNKPPSSVSNCQDCFLYKFIFYYLILLTVIRGLLNGKTFLY